MFDIFDQNPHLFALFQLLAKNQKSQLPVSVKYYGTSLIIIINNSGLISSSSLCFRDFWLD